MSSPRKLILVDGSSYLYRAFHALPPLTSSRGEPTGAVLGVLNMVNKLLKEEAPQLIAVVFDAPGRTFRDDLFEEYKANRPPMPDDLRAQTEPLLEAVGAMGLPVLRIDGVEADDVIGTLARRAAAAGMEVLISTGDKDMAQLVDERVTLVNTMTGSRLDRAGVKAKFDVFPEQIVAYLALVGDSSDNIPGVPRVGPKTAAKWLNEYRALDNLIAHADEISGKVGESLRENLQNLELSRRLATIATDVELAVGPEDLEARDADEAALRTLYQRLEFRTLLRQLGGEEAAAVPAPTLQPPPPSEAPAAVVYETVTREADLERWLARLASASLFAFDTETTSLDYMAAEIVGVSFAIEPGAAVYLPLAHDYAGAPQQLAREQTLERLRPLLEAQHPAKLGHHLKYDAHVLRRYGIELGGMRYDSMLESYVLNSTATRHDMDSVAKRYLGIDTIHYEDVAGKGAKQIPFSQVSIERATEYAAEDADVT
ncbi:MAG TPA: 5'-3' exonuclease H3TH domain-containing protein, partial [Gammaproteobacteria bacterium]|nr:5'-3' exonuclease H3TH domain-containing protein [Gammaproteobacteria bacterium]